MTTGTSNGATAPERDGDDNAIVVWAATVEAIIFASPKPVRAIELQNQLPEGMALETLLPLIEARFREIMAAFDRAESAGRAESPEPTEPAERADAPPAD